MKYCSPFLVLAAILPLTLPNAAAQDKGDKEVRTLVIQPTTPWPKEFEASVSLIGRTCSYDEINSLRNAPAIRFLALQHVYFKSGDGPKAVERLAGMANLESLYVHDCSQDVLIVLDESERKALFPKLVRFSVKGGNLNFEGKAIPSDWVSWRFLEKMPSLKHLSVIGCAFGGKSLKDKKLPTVTTLELTETNVLDGDLEALESAFPGLEELRLERCRINGKGLKALTGLKSLKTLVLLSCALDQDKLPALKDCSKLERLVLHRKDTADQEPISATGAKHIAAIASLKFVEVKVTGPDVLKLFGKVTVNEVKEGKE